VSVSEQLRIANLPVGVTSAAEDGRTVLTYHAEEGRNYVVVLVK